MSNKMTAKSRGMLNQAHIQQVLAEPVRKAAEEKFARDHADDRTCQRMVPVVQCSRQQRAAAGRAKMHERANPAARGRDQHPL